MQLPIPDDPQLERFVANQLDASKGHEQPPQQQRVSPGDGGHTPGEAERWESCFRSVAVSNMNPREVKRVFNYHQLVRGVITHDKQYEDSLSILNGGVRADWRNELVTWCFICWNWREQMDLLFQVG